MKGNGRKPAQMDLDCFLPAFPVIRMWAKNSKL